MDFAALPPEVNSGRMYAGSGSGSMVAAAVAWDGLAAELSTAAGAYRSVVSGLVGGGWQGPASVSMAAAAAQYVAWMNGTAEQAAQSASQARLAAAAYEAAFAATVPPAVITANRTLLMSLVATNILGQNSAAIAAAEAHYVEMWAQDATVMYGYAGGSAAASTLTPFGEPSPNTNPAGVGAQADAVSQAAATSAGQSSSALSQLVSTVPNVLQGLAAGGSLTGLGDPLGSSMGSILGNGADLLNFGSGWTFVASGILFVLGPLLVGPIAAGALPVSSLGWSGSELGASGAGSLLGTAPGALGFGGTAMSAGLGPSPVLAGLGRAGAIGGLSVPPSWATPAITRTTTAMPEPTLVGLPQAEVDALGPGYSAMLPGSLMAAAAGGGGAAGGSWAGTRAGAATQSGATTRTPYGPQPSVIPPAARQAPTHDATPNQPNWPDPHTPTGHTTLNDTIHNQINDLRKQIAELAMERDVLMRSLALWAKGTPEP